MTDIDRKKTYDQIIDAFHTAYSEIGRIVGDEFLLSSASWKIDTSWPIYKCYHPKDFRVRRHLLLYWPHGWCKSTLIEKMQYLYGDDLSQRVSISSDAALRGTVDGTGKKGVFIAPWIIRRPFNLVSELGHLTKGFDDQVVQTLNELLEDGEATVNLGVIHKIDPTEYAGIESKYKDYGTIKFTGDTSYKITMNGIMIAATYDPKFIADQALRSRFNIIRPDPKLLTGKWTRHINDHSGEFYDKLDGGVIEDFRSLIKGPAEVLDIDPEVPEIIYNRYKRINPRDTNAIKSYMRCSKFWGIERSEFEIISYYKGRLASQEEASMSMDNLVQNYIEKRGGAATLKQILDGLNREKSVVYDALKILKQMRIVKKEGDKFVLL